MSGGDDQDPADFYDTILELVTAYEQLREQPP